MLAASGCVSFSVCRIRALYSPLGRKRLRVISKCPNTSVDGLLHAHFIGVLPAPQISDSLCYVINMSMKSGTVPKEWKHARVIPLYKDGKCDEASNYRTISVLPIISKIIERIVHDQLYKFIEENNILN